MRERAKRAQNVRVISRCMTRSESSEKAGRGGEEEESGDEMKGKERESLISLAKFSLSCQ